MQDARHQKRSHAARDLLSLAIMLPAAIALFLVWAAGVALSHTLGGALHLLLPVAIALLLVRHYRGEPDGPAYSAWQRAQKRQRRR